MHDRTCVGLGEGAVVDELVIELAALNELASHERRTRASHRKQLGCQRPVPEAGVKGSASHLHDQTEVHVRLEDVDEANNVGVINLT